MRRLRAILVTAGTIDQRFYLLIAAFIVDSFGMPPLKTWFAWLFFCIAIFSLPLQTWKYIQRQSLGDTEFRKRYPVSWHDIESHRDFVFLMCHSTFLYFWWKWIH